MASGRSDYWYGMLPGKTILGPDQEPWFKWLKERIEFSRHGDFVLYTVPINYRLFLTDGSISCGNPGINRFIIFKDANVVLDIVFDQVQILPISEGGAYVFEALEIIKVRFYNKDWVDNDFYMTLSGFLQYLKI